MKAKKTTSREAALRIASDVVKDAAVGAEPDLAREYRRIAREILRLPLVLLLVCVFTGLSACGPGPVLGSYDAGTCLPDGAEIPAGDAGLDPGACCSKQGSAQVVSQGPSFTINYTCGISWDPTAKCDPGVDGGHTVCAPGCRTDCWAEGIQSPCFCPVADGG